MGPLGSRSTAPRILAELFETVVGAVFLQYGFLRLCDWLRVIFETSSTSLPLRFTGTLLPEPWLSAETI